MEKNVEQQILEQLKKAGKILIVLPENLSADALSAGLALRLFLEKQQKDVTVACSGLVPAHLKFLPGTEVVQSVMPGGKSLVVSLNTVSKKLEELSYQKTDGKVNIYLKSQGEEFDEKDISFSKENAPLDLIIALAGRSLEDFGEIFEKAADKFFETPKVNIDCQSANEYFGAINLVDLTATSVSEILTELMQKYEQELMDEDIATCLLSGIIEKTSSFQHVITTPRAFLKASELVALGGRQQEIVKNIFKTKSLALIKLLGRALAKIKFIQEISVAYAPISQTDFEKTGASSSEVLGVLRELIDNLNGNNIFAILFEVQTNKIGLLMAVHEQFKMDNLLKVFPDAKQLSTVLKGLKLVECVFEEKTLEEAEMTFKTAVEKSIV